MSDHDPRKLISLALDGEHHVLRKEVAQTALADASREISASADWTAISRDIHARSVFYAERPWLKRTAS
jgi:hypothetical protein